MAKGPKEPEKDRHAVSLEGDTTKMCFAPNAHGNKAVDLQLVIDQKRIFLFWPKTNIRQENAAEYSADNEYSAQGSKHFKNVYLNQEQKCFLGW
jgi:hypothetical protein